MSDFNIFSSKTDIKKLLFTTDKFKFDEQQSTDSWQDLPGAIHTSSIDNQTLTSSLSSLSDNRNDYGWETVDDCSTISKSYGINYEQISQQTTSYCRLDRRRQWLLLPPKSQTSVIHNDSDHIVSNCISKTTNNQQQTTDENFQDSCESSTLSLDFHVEDDELLLDNRNRQIKSSWKTKTSNNSIQKQSR